MAIFRLKAKVTINRNGCYLEKGSTVEVTVKNAATPFYNGCVEIKKAFMDKFKFDYEKAKCSANDFYAVKINN